MMMRAHALFLLLVVAQQCGATRHLRQLTVQCPDELAKPVLQYMSSDKYKSAVAKACAKRPNPNCYLECSCTAYATVGAVLAYEGQRNYPKLMDKHGSACVLAFTNKVIETVLPEHVKKEQERVECLQTTMDWTKSVMEDKKTATCPALAEYLNEKRRVGGRNNVVRPSAPVAVP